MKGKLLALILIVNLFPGCGSRSAEAAFDEFLTAENKESFIVQPLCGAGESVVPLVIEGIKNKKMERRRYAIMFLGTTGGKAPLPVLRDIVKDESETVYFRADALESVHLLDENLGKSLAADYRNRTDLLGETSNKVWQVKNYADYRKNQIETICRPKD